jgi:hypothetical protein
VPAGNKQRDEAVRGRRGARAPGQARRQQRRQGTGGVDDAGVRGRSAECCFFFSFLTIKNKVKKCGRRGWLVCILVVKLKSWPSYKKKKKKKIPKKKLKKNIGCTHAASLAQATRSATIVKAPSWAAAIDSAHAPGIMDANWRGCRWGEASYSEFIAILKIITQELS